MQQAWLLLFLKSFMLARDLAGVLIIIRKEKKKEGEQ